MTAPREIGSRLTRRVLLALLCVVASLAAVVLGAGSAGADGFGWASDARAAHHTHHQHRAHGRRHHGHGRKHSHARRHARSASRHGAASSGHAKTPAAAAPKAASSASSTRAAGPFLATLDTHLNTAKRESSAGMKVAMLESNWRDFEPQQGQYSASYESWLKQQLHAFQSAGMRVTLGLGLHYTPKWVLSQPDSRLRDEHGNTSAQANLVFNQNLRNEADAYLQKLAATLGMDNIWAVRVTAGGQDELIYPSTSYWAYSSGAQNGSDMPPSMARNPMPGWKPGRPASVAQRTKWVSWYEHSLSNVADWQMTQMGLHGFRGYFQVITPGVGIQPTQVKQTIADGLPDSLIGRGAAWAGVYHGLHHRSRITAYSTSVADGSGGNVGCSSSDDSTNIRSYTTKSWSAARWITRIARYNGFTVAGEIPGYNSAAKSYYANGSSSGLLSHAMTLARSCHFLGLYWAHDDQVWNGTTSLSTLSRYTSPSAVEPSNA